MTRHLTAREAIGSPNWVTKNAAGPHRTFNDQARTREELLIAREKAVKETAIQDGLEVLTAKGAAYLFDKSLERVRSARLADPENSVAFVLTAHKQPAYLMCLDWARKRWPKDFSQERLDLLRENAQTLFHSGAVYLVLHDGPLTQDLSSWTEGDRERPMLRN